MHVIKNFFNGKVFQYFAALTGKIMFFCAFYLKLPIMSFPASLTAFSAGIALGWTAQITEELLNGELGFPITKDELGWIGSLVPLGAAAFSLFTGIICDSLGRKLTMLLLIIPKTIGWCLIIWAKTITMMYIGRFLTGMISGAYCALSSIYISEIAQKEIRGTLGSYTQLMITAGVLYASVCSILFNVRVYTLTCGIIPLIFGLIFIFMPETPIYLTRKGDSQKTRLVLTKLRDATYDIDKEIKEIENCVHEDQSPFNLQIIKTTLKSNSTQKACIIGFGLMIFKVTCGVDAIIEYTSYIFLNAKVYLDPQSQTIILNVISVATAIFQSLVVDKAGRRLLMSLSSLIITISLIIVGIIFMIKDRDLISSEYYIYIDYLPLIALTVYSIAFSLGLGPIPWIILGEIFPQEIKSIAASIGTFLSWITAFAVTKLFFVIDSSWGADITFFIFAVCTGITVIFILILVPETKGKSFEEIQCDLL